MSFSANDWFYTPKEQALQIIKTSGLPFNNVTFDEFYDIVSACETHRYLSTLILRVAGPIISGFGIILTAMLIATLWRKAVTQKNSFYRAMLLIAIIDLLFNVCAFMHYTLYKMYKLLGSSNYIFMNVLVGNKGLMFMISGISDMCAVVLTLERYLGIGHAHVHRVLTDKFKTPVKILATLFVVLVSSTRLHYVVDFKVTASGSLYFFTLSELGSTRFVRILTMISDVILPAVMLASMLVLSTLFRLAVARRMKKQIAKLRHVRRSTIGATLATASDIPSNNNASNTGGTQMDFRRVSHLSQVTPVDVPAPTLAPALAIAQRSQNPAETAVHDLKSIMTLTLALDALFLLNQAGYCFYFFAEQLVQHYEISYDSNYPALLTRAAIIKFEAYADVEASLGELVSHAGNFLLYVCLSASMRQDFRNLVRRMKCN